MIFLNFIVLFFFFFILIIAIAGVSAQSVWSVDGSAVAHGIGVGDVHVLAAAARAVRGLAQCDGVDQLCSGVWLSDCAVLEKSELLLCFVLFVCCAFFHDPKR